MCPFDLTVILRTQPNHPWGISFKLSLQSSVVVQFSLRRRFSSNHIFCSCERQLQILGPNHVLITIEYSEYIEKMFEYSSVNFC